ncbi:MAG: transglycosylase domain-containing protein [Deltaproteobacteria bacterium]|nr:transglycosylase domain-containing protein [Deltaproteobacteria bacterium]
MKRGFKRFLIRFLKIVAALFVVLGLAGAGLGAWYVSHLSGVVKAKFEGRKWEFPSKIYADSKIIYPGMYLSMDEVRDKLRRLGYRISKARPRTKGEYRILGKNAVIEVYLHDFRYPLRDFRGFPVRISLKSGTIHRIQRLDDNEVLPSLELEPEVVTGFYDRVREQRRVVRLDEVPARVRKTVLAVEDERFYYHRGVDPVAVMRAFLANVRRGGVVQGGSTLTQQLMKNFFLGSERTLERKVKEALMALITEWLYTKDQILENYLNEIYLGQNGAQGIFGIWEAARFYFVKEPEQLTVGETALLAGLIRAPNRYSPYRSAGEATRRRNVVLAKLVSDGVITRRAYEHALQEVFEKREPVRLTNSAPYFTDYVKKELAEHYSEDTLTAEGLRIFTSLDLEIQQAAEKALSEGLARLEKDYRHLRKTAKQDDLEGALVVIKPQTGEIKAMVGGRDYGKSQFNRVAQAKRQPGSVFKPFVYLAALTHGSAQGSGSYEGWVTLREAMEKSLNAATARIAQDVGIKKVREMAYRMGIQSRLPLLPSLSLGAVEVTPLEMAGAYSALANNGVRTHLLSIKNVLDRDAEVLEKRNIRVKRVLSPRVAFDMHNMLRGVVERGTAQRVRELGFTRPAAGKTGTTNDSRDAWFAGYTPDLLALVWVGFDRQSELGLSGSRAALPIWTDFMKHATSRLPVTDFITPPGTSARSVHPRTKAVPGPPRNALARAVAR